MMQRSSKSGRIIFPQPLFRSEERKLAVDMFIANESRYSGGDAPVLTSAFASDMLPSFRWDEKSSDMAM